MATADPPARPPPWLRARKLPDGRRVPLTIAHRGGTTVHPENSLLSFQAALEAGADAIETDAQLTQDHVVVLSHRGLLKPCFGLDKQIGDTRFAEIQQLRTLRAPHVGLPTLSELLELLLVHDVRGASRRHPPWILLDIKPWAPPDLQLHAIALALSAAPPSRAALELLQGSEYGPHDVLPASSSLAVPNGSAAIPEPDAVHSLDSLRAQYDSSALSYWSTRVVLGCWSKEYLDVCRDLLPGYQVAGIGFFSGYLAGFYPSTHRRNPHTSPIPAVVDAAAAADVAPTAQPQAAAVSDLSAGLVAFHPLTRFPSPRLAKLLRYMPLTRTLRTRLSFVSGAVQCDRPVWVYNMALGHGESVARMKVVCRQAQPATSGHAATRGHAATNGAVQASSKNAGDGAGVDGLIVDDVALFAAVKNDLFRDASVSRTDDDAASIDGLAKEEPLPLKVARVQAAREILDALVAALLLLLLEMVGGGAYWRRRMRWRGEARYFTQAGTVTGTSTGSPDNVEKRDGGVNGGLDKREVQSGATAEARLAINRDPGGGQARRALSAGGLAASIASAEAVAHA